ncbi:MAG: YqaJ viral recombinase family protein [Pseudomonadota bacterium]
MKTHDLTPGSDAWHLHRKQHFNASDAPAMMGRSPYRTRTDLLHELHTGLAPTVDASTQRIFDQGHRIEAAMRPIGEAIIGDDLAPVVGTAGELSASFDGLTFMGHEGWECKTVNDDLRAALPNEGRDSHALNDASKLPLHFRIQMEQQLHVSGARRILFTAGRLSDDDEVIEERHAWYTPDQALCAQIISGWKQFAEDLAAYVPSTAPAVEKIVAEPVEALPAVFVRVEGSIVVHENFDAFEVAVRNFLEHRLIRAPKNDQAFADLEVQIKAMKGAEAALDGAEEGWIAQIEAVSNAKRRKDVLRALVRENRLMAEKILSTEKERRRTEIVMGGTAALKAHVDALNARLGKPYMPIVTADFAGCVKGLKSLASMEDKVAGELARCKIAANDVADRIDINLKWLREHAAAHTFLFADAPGLVLKAHDDLVALAQNRIAAHNAEVARKEEEQRAQIRAEEQERADREARTRLAAEQAEQARIQREAEEAERKRIAAAAPAPTAAPTPEPTQPPAAVQIVAPAPSSQAVVANSPLAAPAVIQMAPRPAPTAAPTLKLGDLNARIAPLSIDAAGLAKLGFVHQATDKSAKLYHAGDFGAMVDSMVAHLRAAAEQNRLVS